MLAEKRSHIGRSESSLTGVRGYYCIFSGSAFNGYCEIKLEVAFKPSISSYNQRKYHES